MSSASTAGTSKRPDEEPGRAAGGRPGGEEAASGGREAGPLPSRIVLVGFMAAGKTTVGRRLAERIGFRFVDLDREVERRAGRPIPQIFDEQGEPAFRALEAAVTRDLDPADGVVVAAGGGWMARPELRSRWPDAVRVWLRVSPGDAVSRLGDQVGSRPMLDPRDPEASAREILEDRRVEYQRAELSVDTGGVTPEEVVTRILDALAGS